MNTFWPRWLTNGVEMLAFLGPYDWYILGAVLCLLELHVPGASFIWLAVAAFMVGIYADVDHALGYPAPTWQMQVIAFAVLAMVAVILWSRFGRRVETRSDQPFLNRRLEGMIGQTLTLRDPILNGAGTAKVGDTTWPVQGPDAPAGARVVVAGVNGPTLIVAPAGAGAPQAAA